jgi:hypothetical protein
VHPDFLGAALIYTNAKSPHGLHGREAVLAFKKTAHLGDALGNAAEHQCTMRNGLVARDTNGAVDATDRLNNVVRHRSEVA